MNKLISIIIPTYNMEKYLDKCLTSLVVDDHYMEMVEVLVINDGSKDNSSDIAHWYEEKYPQTFRIIDKENGNYGSCVNRGLRDATGKYIKVLDADDYFDSSRWCQFLNFLMEIDADLILTDYILVDEDDHQKEYRKFDLCHDKALNTSDVLIPLSEVEMHAITYKRSILIDMKYCQTEGISYTDTEWATIPFLNISLVVYHPIPVYIYLIGREGQTMDPKVYLRKRNEIFTVYNKILDICKDNELLRKKNALFFKRRLLNFYSRSFSQSLIYNEFPSSELIPIDRTLRQKATEIYEELSSLTYSNIHYVEIWRNNNHNMPLLQMMVICIIRMKQKYFPQLSFGRIK